MARGNDANGWSLSSSLPCADQLLVGCSDSLSDSHAHGTWVIGDRGVDALSARPRKVFGATDGPYNCETNELWTHKDLGGLSAHECQDVISDPKKSCWGVLVNQI